MAAWPVLPLTILHPAKTNKPLASWRSEDVGVHCIALVQSDHPCLCTRRKPEGHGSPQGSPQEPVPLGSHVGQTGRDPSSKQQHHELVANPHQLYQIQEAANCVAHIQPIAEVHASAAGCAQELEEGLGGALVAKQITFCLTGPPGQPRWRGRP